jgi:hypothetical protein
MTKGKATAIAFFISPGVPALWFCLAARITRHFDLLAQLGLFSWFFNIAMLVMIVLSIPAILLGERLNLIKWWSALIVGAVIGAIVTVIIQNKASSVHRHVPLGRTDGTYFLGNLENGTR